MSVVGSPSEPVDRKKRTRTRKRRIRTDPEDLPAPEDDEEQPSRKSVKTAASEEDTTVQKEESGDDDNNEEDLSGKPKEKRKRKRTRGKSKKEGVTEVDASKDTTTILAPQQFSKISESMQKYLDSLGDPQDKIDTLNEKTINALGYARQYHLARSEWKFNKAKQEYLIRHMLTPPPVQAIEEGNRQDDKKGDDNGKDDDDAATPDQQHWPDEWNQCVAKYLATIQGKAKERILDVLTKAAEQEIPAMPLQVSPAAPSIESASAPFKALEKKSVSFGDLAMAQDAAGNETQDLSSTFTAGEVQRRQFQKDRAAKLLFELRN